MATRSTTIADIDALLAACACSHLVETLRHESITAWASILVDDRPAFIRRLQRLGVAGLGERQRIANALAHAVREGVIDVAHGGGTPTVMTASEALLLARGAISALRQELTSLNTASRDARLSSLGLPATFLSCDEHEALHVVAPLRLTRALEAIEFPSAAARVLPNALKYAQVRIGFLFDLRGAVAPSAANVAAFDYADYGERLLGVTAFIVLYAGGDTTAPFAQRLHERFGERVLRMPPGSEIAEAHALLTSHRLSHLYVYKHGHASNPSVAQLMEANRFAACNSASGHKLRILIHAAFDGRTKHGDVYAVRS